MTVYLIGDSVRLASEPYTRAALPEVDIVSPSENCRSSHDVLEHIRQWTEGRDCGRHYPHQLRFARHPP